MKTTIVILLILPLVSLANEKPFFSSIPIESIGESELYSYQIIVNDLDDDTLKIIINEKPDWLNYIDNGNNTALLTGIPSTLTGNFVSISVTDTKDTITQEFNITVYCTNCCATFLSNPITNIMVDSLYTYNISATDINSNVIISMDTVPNWLTFTFNYPNNASLSGIPSINDTGTYKISIRAERESELCPNENYQIYYLRVINTSLNPTNINSINYKILISPNPFINELAIQTNRLKDVPIDIEIYNSVGQLSYNERITNFNNCIILDLKYLRPGFYFIRLIDRNNIFAQQIIKKETH